MESYVVMQQKLDTHKRLYKEADESIKRINGLEKYENSRVIITNGERRKVSILDEKSNKRKSYDDQKTFTNKNNKRIVSSSNQESADEDTVNFNAVNYIKF